MKAVFLSASIPDPKRNPKYYTTCSSIYIREAVSVLLEVLLPQGILVWGGHPAIAPVVRLMAERLGHLDRVETWQSEWFRKFIPQDTEALHDLRWAPGDIDREASLATMRTAMLNAHPLAAAIFVGGMEGVEDEFRLVTEFAPGTPRYAVASTGAAARLLWTAHPQAELEVQRRLETDLAYDLLFEDLLNPLL